MKKLRSLLIALALVSVCCSAHAQVITKYGDNLSTLDGIMKAYYDVVTVKKGEKPSYQRDSMLHVPNVNVGWAAKSKDGKTTVKYVTLKEYHRLSDDYLSASGFDEREISRKVEKFGAIDIVIANAGITLYGDFFSYTPESFYKVLQVNLGGSFFLAQAAANKMKGQKTGGSILLMSSVTGHQAHKNLAAYGMTKAALEMLAKSLVIELSPHHININAIAPGATLTERTVDDKDYEKIWSKITPLGKPATTIDIANAALFLVSDNAKHITGQSLVVDGGWTSVSPEPF